MHFRVVRTTSSELIEVQIVQVRALDAFFWVWKTTALLAGEDLGYRLGCFPRGPSLNIKPSWGFYLPIMWWIVFLWSMWGVRLTSLGGHACGGIIYQRKASWEGLLRGIVLRGWKYGQYSQLLDVSWLLLNYWAMSMWCREYGQKVWLQVLPCYGRIGTILNSEVSFTEVKL